MTGAVPLTESNLPPCGGRAALVVLLISRTHYSARGEGPRHWLHSKLRGEKLARVVTGDHVDD